MRLLSLAAALSLSACAPTLFFPGRELHGSLASGTVSDWSFSDASTTVQLETRPSRPYSIIVWGVGRGPDFYISAESWRTLLGLGEARWVAHVADDPEVRLRIGDSLYERKAVRVQDPAEIASVLGLFEKKYGRGTPLERRLADRGPEDWQRVRVFRLDPREAD